MNVYAAMTLLLVGFASGWNVQGWRWAAADAQRLMDDVQARDAGLAQADTAAASHEAARARLRVEFNTIYSEVDRVVAQPVYRSVCLDGDGMRALTAAIRGPAAGQPAPAVPGSDRAR